METPSASRPPPPAPPPPRRVPSSPPAPALGGSVPSVPSSETQAIGAPTTIRQASYLDALRTVRPSDVFDVHRKTCTRDAFLFGIGSGFAVGGVRLVLGGSTWRSMTYFYVAWAVGSVGAFEFCRRRKELERKGMARATEIMERKKTEKGAEMQRIKDERVRRRAEEEERRRARSRSEWWTPGDARRKDGS